MRIKIDGKEYLVPAEEQALLLKQFQGMLMNEYRKMDETLQFAAKPIARGILLKMENKAREQYGKEAALKFRPAKKQDAVDHLSSIIMSLAQEAMRHATLSVATDAHTIAAFRLELANPRQAGGQVVTDGHQRLRENDGTQVP